jgi:transcription elongation GreA/GreB family factor
LKLDKKKLQDALVAALQHDRDTLLAAQRLTAEGVTHEDARAEGLKDMRATEASYIARGQAQRVDALSADVARLRAMTPRAFSEDDPVALGAVVTTSSKTDEEPDSAATTELYVAPAGGGQRLEVAGAVYQVVTPSSPVGRALMGARVGDVVEVRRGDAAHEIVVAAVR